MLKVTDETAKLESEVFVHQNEEFSLQTENNESKEQFWGNKSQISSKETSFLGSERNLNQISNKITKSRTILWYLTFIGFAINYMLRVNLNIAIVDMVQRRSTYNLTYKLPEAECYNRTNMIATEIYANNTTVSEPEYKTRFSLERMILKFLKIDFDKNGFEWNEYQQGLLLGSFYWLSWATALPGGVLARKYGTKIVFGLANLIACLMCSLIPIAAFIDLQLVLILRVLQGLMIGLTWPSVHEIIARWIPPNERSTFVTVYMGSSIGIAVFFPLFGYIMALTSWEWVYHLCTIAGSVWYFAWNRFVFDSPAKHPHIHKKEKEYIEYALGSTVQKDNKAPTPWMDILTSRPILMIVISTCGGNYAIYTLITQTPTYFKVILGWNIGMVGLLSGFPHLVRMVFAYLFSSFCDNLLTKNKLSRTNVRKLAVVVSHILAGITILSLTYSGCNSILAVIFLSSAVIVSGAITAGPISSIVDISPNYASIISGVNGVLAILPGLISAFVVGKLTLDNQTIQQWKYVFYITSSILFASGTLYVLFANSDIQSWNDPKHDQNRKPTMPLENEIKEQSEVAHDGKKEKFESHTAST